MTDATASARSDAPRPTRDRPWVMRTYAGHSSAAASNALYRRNLAKGQTGLSVAFDLPTQTGYDPDHVLSRGEVGKVGVPISHIGDMAALFDGIPLSDMNTSMTINATAMWLLAMYQVTAEEQAAAAGEDPAEWVHRLAGTTQNDIIKEYLSRGTYAFPPGPSLRLITDMISYTVNEIPKWNPTNICSYHLQEAGATPVQEIAYAMCTAIAVLDAVKQAGAVGEADFPELFGRLSFFVNAGIRFITEMCEMRAFVEARVKPYYLHHPDLAPGTGHFRLPIAEGRRIVVDMMRQVSGLARPAYVLDIPGGYGKIPLGAEAASNDGAGAWRLTDPAGRAHSYRDD